MTRRLTRPARTRVVARMVVRVRRCTRPWDLPQRPRPQALRQAGSVVAVALAAATALPAPALAQDDAQLWTMGVAQGRVGERLAWYAEAQPRFTDDGSRLGQLLLRPAFGVQLGARTQALLGYAYVRTAPPGVPATEEHRAWQQLIWPITSAESGLRVNARSRLEQRTIVGASDLGWRVRQQVRAQMPLGGRDGRVAAVVWTEPFVHLNTTAWGARRGLDQWRTFVGAAVPLGGGVTLEPGYLLQRVARPGEDRSNHVLSLNVLMWR